MEADLEEYMNPDEELSVIDGDGEYASSKNLKNTLHGNSYQLKLLLLFLHCGMQKGCAFRLATEMDSAGKFDDLVFQYHENGGTLPVHRFLQVKHRQNETKKIQARDLVSERENDFSLRKYFASYLEIQKNPEFSKSESKDFVIYTNIDLDFESLEAKKIHPQKIESSDDFLNFESSSKHPARYKLLVEDQSELYTILKKSCIAQSLAMALAEHVFKKKKITSRTTVFELYLPALVDEQVIDVGKKSFTDNFKNGQNLSKRAEDFRDIFCAEFLRRMKLAESSESTKLMWTKIESDGLLCLAENFATQISTKPKNPLPEVEIVDGQKISAFFRELVFAVNQPNEIELGGILARKLAGDRKLDLGNANLAYDSLLNKMMDWFKNKGEEPGKGGVFLTHADGQAFFKSLKEELNTLVCWGLTSAYLEEIADYGIVFRNENQSVSEYLEPESADRTVNQPALNLIAAEETLLTAIRVHQTIRKTQRYEKNDSLIFLPLDRLLLPGIKRQVTRAFEMENSYNLLIIECGSGVKESLPELYSKLQKTMRKNSAKKLILITQGIKNSADIQPRLHFKNSTERLDDVRFNDLIEDSKNKVLKKPCIIFQGLHERRISIRELFEDRSSGEIASMKLIDFQDLIDPGTLARLIRGDEIRVGWDMQEMNETTDFYINRRINPAFLKKDVLTSSSSSDVFAVSGIDRESLGVLLGLKGHLPSRIVILENEKEVEHFARLCQDNSAIDVHWLQYEKGMWIWKYSSKNIANLLAYRDTSERPRNSNYLTEDQIADQNEVCKVFIISATAGMGKTTMCKSLAARMKARESSLWVIRVDLNNFTSVLRQENEAEKLGRQSLNEKDVDQAVNFLVEKLSCLKTDFEKKCLKTVIGNQCTVVAIFDGFDKISPDYEKLISDLLQALKKSTGIKKLFISTRPHLSESLEKSMGVFCHTLEPFSEKDQTDFLVRFWKTRLHMEDVDGRIKRYAQALIKQVSQLIADRGNEFAGIPLQIRIIAEVYQDQKDGPNDPMLEKITNIVDLYRCFVVKKFDIYIAEKLKADLTNLFMKDVIDNYRKTFFKTHQELALYTLFEPKDLHTLLPGWERMESISKCISQVNTINERIGIVTLVIDHKPRFIHQSFAEYFVASFLADQLQDLDHNPELREFFVGQVLLQPNHRIIRSFLNGISLKKSPPSYREIKNRSSADEAWMSTINKNRDDWNRTVFHIAAIEGHVGIMKFILNAFLPLDETWTDLINVEDCGDMSALTLAIYNQQWEVIEYLMEHCRGEHRQISAILDMAAGAGNLPVLKCCLEKKVDHGVKDELGQTVLITAASNGRLEVVKYLLDEVGVDVDFRDKCGQPVLHIIGMNDQVEIFKWLVDEKKFDLEDRSRSVVSTLHMVFAMKRWKTMRWLIENLGKDYRFHDVATVLEKVTSSWKYQGGRFTADLDNLDVNVANKYGKMKLEGDIKSGNLEANKLLIENEVFVWFEVEAVTDTFSFPVRFTAEMLNILQWIQRV